MKQPRIDIGSIRRNQIVEAAIAIIAERGVQHLSLSEIEQKAGMSRGQLTYYFPAKEDIWLAVFDRLLELMHQRVRGEGGDACDLHAPAGWDRMKQFLTVLLLLPPEAPEFHALQYTFLSQIGHRDDFRRRLAHLYEEWRGNIARDVEAALAHGAGVTRVSARTVATLVQAILHGLAIQRQADPDSYDRQEMLELCLDLLGNYLRPRNGDAGPTRPSARKSISANGSSAGNPARRSSRKSRVKHE